MMLFYFAFFLQAKKPALIWDWPQPHANSRTRSWSSLVFIYSSRVKIKEVVASEILTLRKRLTFLQCENIQLVDPEALLFNLPSSPAGCSWGRRSCRSLGPRRYRDCQGGTAAPSPQGKTEWTPARSPWTGAARGGRCGAPASRSETSTLGGIN